MEFKIKTHKETPQAEWDALISKIDESTYLHSWNWIYYNSLFRDDGIESSFILMDTQGLPLAVCPLGLSVDPSTHIKELAIGGNPLGAPAIVNIKPRLRRKIQTGVYDLIRKFSKEHGVQLVRMVSHPLTLGFCRGSVAACANVAEHLKFQLIPDIDNTCIIDLSLSIETLTENLSPYQRKHYRKSKKQGVTVRAFTKDENAHELKHYLEAQRQAHYLSAKRWTRPASTWNAMVNRALQGQGTLFVSFLNNEKPMSFLFCGEYGSMSFGWSQVNLEEFEHEYSLRHFLECEAIFYYKNKGFKFYEVGERHFGPTWMSHHSEKEITISEFKERFGGFMLPKIRWSGFLDQTLMKNTLQKNIDVLTEQPLELAHKSKLNDD